MTKSAADFALTAEELKIIKIGVFGIGHPTPSEGTQKFCDLVTKLAEAHLGLLERAKTLEDASGILAVERSAKEAKRDLAAAWAALGPTMPTPAFLHERIATIINDRNAVQKKLANIHASVTHLQCVFPTPSSAVCLPEDKDEKQTSRDVNKVNCFDCLRAALECDRAIIKARGLPARKLKVDEMIAILRAARAEATPQGMFDVPWENLTDSCQENWRIEARAVLHLIADQEKTNV